VALLCLLRFFGAVAIATRPARRRASPGQLWVVMLIFLAPVPVMILVEELVHRIKNGPQAPGRHSHDATAVHVMSEKPRWRDRPREPMRWQPFRFFFFPLSAFIASVAGMASFGLDAVGQGRPGISPLGRIGDTFASIGCLTAAVAIGAAIGFYIERPVRKKR